MLYNIFVPPLKASGKNFLLDIWIIPRNVGMIQSELAWKILQTLTKLTSASAQRDEDKLASIMCQTSLEIKMKSQKLHRRKSSLHFNQKKF